MGGWGDRVADACADVIIVRTWSSQDMVLVEDDADASEFLTRSMRQMEELTSAMRRKSLKKRMVRRVGLVVGGCEIALQTYACIRPTRPGEKNRGATSRGHLSADCRGWVGASH